MKNNHEAVEAGVIKKYQRKDRRKKVTMKVSGKSVIRIKRVIEAKSKN